jgi:uncharacterized membrane protein YjjP (DUF1212 family)
LLLLPLLKYNFSSATNDIVTLFSNTFLLSQRPSILRHVSTRHEATSVVFAVTSSLAQCSITTATVDKIGYVLGMQQEQEIMLVALKVSDIALLVPGLLCSQPVKAERFITLLEASDKKLHIICNTFK